MAQRTEVWYCLACGVRSERPVVRGGRPHWCKDCAANTRFRTCAECGEVKPMTGYICRDCNHVRSQERNKGKQLLLTVRQPKPRPQPASIKGTRVWVSGPCLWCGTSFVIVDQLTARYCSKQCGKQHTKQRYGQFIVQPLVRLSIYERDDWTCQLCFEPIDRAAPRNSDWAPSLDHVVCKSWGAPDHTPANLRTAHRWCNAVRGDERWYSAEFFAA